MSRFTRARICARCDGRGYVPIKGGTQSKVCPFCDGKGETTI